MLWFDIIDIGYLLVGALLGFITAALMCISGENSQCEECDYRRKYYE